jgi:hypothetical protein
MDMIGFDEEDLLFTISESFVPEIGGEYFKSIQATGFLIHEIKPGGNGAIESLLLTITTTYPKRHDIRRLLCLLTGWKC